MAERRIRGDLIKVYKIINNYSDVRPEILNVSNNRNNLFSKFNFMSSSNNDLSKVFQSSLQERVKSYWNVLPIKIKKSKSILEFKKNLESNKTENKASINENYYGVSTTLLKKWRMNAT